MRESWGRGCNIPLFLPLPTPFNIPTSRPFYLPGSQPSSGGQLGGGNMVFRAATVPLPLPLPLIHHKPKCKYKQQQETLKQESDFNLQEYIQKNICHWKYLF